MPKVSSPLTGCASATCLWRSLHDGDGCLSPDGQDEWLAALGRLISWVLPNGTASLCVGDAFVCSEKEMRKLAACMYGIAAEVVFSKRPFYEEILMG